MFAARTNWQLTENSLTRLLEDRRASGRPVLDLTESNPTRCDFTYPEEEILRAVSRREALSYRPDPRGLPEARQALSQEYRSRGVFLPAANLVLTSGTSEAYSFLFRLLADPGDRVLVPCPSYPLFELLAQINDVELAPYILAADRGFAIDFDSLATQAEQGASALLLVSPGNPTGSFLKRAELEKIVAICTSRGIPIICDEVFGDYAFDQDDGRAGSLAGEGSALTFTLNGLSKMLALPQLKVAWIALNGPARDVSEALARLDLIADTYLSVNTPAQLAIPDLLALRPGIQRQVMDRIAANRSHLMQAALPPGCRPLESEGGWYTILTLPEGASEDEWTARLLDKEGVVTHPGYFFDFQREGYLVLSLLPAESVFREGIDRLARHFTLDG